MEVLIAKDPNVDTSKQDLPFSFYCPVCKSLLKTTLGDYKEDSNAKGFFYVECPVCNVRLYKAD